MVAVILRIAVGTVAFLVSLALFGCTASPDPVPPSSVAGEPLAGAHAPVFAVLARRTGGLANVTTIYPSPMPQFTQGLLSQEL